MLKPEQRWPKRPEKRTMEAGAKPARVAPVRAKLQKSLLAAKHQYCLKRVMTGVRLCITPGHPLVASKDSTAGTFVLPGKLLRWSSVQQSA
ncbi:hypothetical protein MES4922_300109 [Mesorhizobium ventifaucium]|uniref:Hedgehog/Intein (Hint) domain-containing protein n=1 Tax=Mesorhizobium ventifaucium TaxID=666020 RepID=A0ABN8JXZ3_9HYPH|nr:hypothetical protein MES4922_300109 [Mesorhizobium ventifaucium]